MDVGHWYPSRGIVEKIEGELRDLQKAAALQFGETQNHLAQISDVLVAGISLPQFPKHQIERWLWLASLLRNAGDREVRDTAGAAILYLHKTLNGKSTLSDSDAQKLRWVAGAASEKISKVLGWRKIYSPLSDEDLRRVGEQILKQLQDPSPIPDIRAAIAPQIEQLQKICGSWYLPTIFKKIDALIDAAESGDEKKSRLAKAALSYLAAEEDAVPDTFGVIGLVDDIYVIEWAYAAITGSAARLPLLEGLVSEWPFLQELLFEDRDELFGLDRYLAYLVGLTLFALFEAEASQLLLVREAGPVGLVSAVFAAICSLERNDDSSTDENALLKDMPILIGSDNEVFKAVYLKKEQINGRLVHWVQVAQNGRLTIADDALEYVKPAALGHKTLSKGNEVSAWLKERHPSALSFIIKNHSRINGPKTGILVFTQKKKLDNFLKDIRPFGVDVGSLVGLRYVSSKGLIQHFNAAATDVPLIYAVSDPDVAVDLLKTRPPHIANWVVLADGARASVPLYAAMKSSPETANTKICVLGELHERESGAELGKLGLTALVADFSDVEIPAFQSTAAVPKASSVRKYMERSAVHCEAKIKYVDVSDADFEMLEEAFETLDRSEEGRSGAILERLAITVGGFIRRATAYPIGVDDALKGDLSRQATEIRAEARLYRNLSKGAGPIFEIFDAITQEEHICPDRRYEIRQQISEAIVKKLKTAVLCRSAVVASASRSIAASDEQFSSVEWISSDDLPKWGPYDRLIVPTWLGRSLMREISNGGFAREIIYVLLPYERAWLTSTTDANNRWLRRLRAETVRQERKVVAKLKGVTERQTLWEALPSRDPDGEEKAEFANVSIEEIVPEVDRLEARVIDAILNQEPADSRDPTAVTAQLVLFEETGAYAYLPPAGKVIALSAIKEDAGPTDHESPTSAASGKRAEDLLFKKVVDLRPGMVVAFPVGTDRNLIDARADQFLKDSESVRVNAGLWKDAVRRFTSVPGNTYEGFSFLLAEAGVRRKPSTVHAWVSGNDTVGPRNYRRVIPIISQVTKDPRLKLALPHTLSDIDLIYRARETAAAAIVEEIFTGDIDLDMDRFSFDVDGRRLTYELHRVRSLEREVQVPFDQLGKILRYDGPQTIQSQEISSSI